MKFFNKKETIVENISFFSIMSAINVIFVMLTAIFPPLMFLIVFILPLTSAVVTLLCKKKYYFIYFIVTVGLCLLCSFGIYMYDTFFYVIPALITGLIFGILIEKNVPPIHILTVTTIIQYVLTILTFIILDKILPSFDFFSRLYNIFGLNNFKFKAEFFHIFCFLLASIQNLFSFVFIYYFLKRFQFSFNLKNDNKLLINIGSFCASILAIIGYFFYSPLVYIGIFLSMFYFVYQTIELILTKNKSLIISLVVMFIIMLFAYPLLYSYPKRPLAIILLLILIGPVNILDLCNNTLLKRQVYIE